MAGETDLKISGINFQPVIFRNYPASQAPETATVPEKKNNGQESSRENVLDSVSISREASVLNKATAQTQEGDAVAQPAQENNNPQEVITRRLTEMKTVLEGITKNYPPFPADSKDRAAILESYSALRKQIERLTFPPAMDAFNNRKGWMWDDLFKKEVVAKLPEPMAPSVSDDEVHKAVGTLAAIQDAVTNA